MILDYIALVILIAVIALVVYGLIGVWSISYEIAKGRNHPHRRLFGPLATGGRDPPNPAADEELAKLCDLILFGYRFGNPRASVRPWPGRTAARIGARRASRRGRTHALH